MKINFEKWTVGKKSLRNCVLKEGEKHCSSNVYSFLIFHFPIFSKFDFCLFLGDAPKRGFLLDWIVSVKEDGDH